MVQEFDVATRLRNGVPDREAAWSFIADFAAAWAAPLVTGDGVPAEMLDDAEQALGLSLPAALREGYQLFGQRPDLTDNQDPLLPPAELFVHDEFDGVLVFRGENLGCAFWGVRLEDLDKPDPPVVVQSRSGWIPYMERVSLACVELVLSETLTRDDRLGNACELPNHLIAQVTQQYERVALPDYPSWTGPEESPMRWYSAPGKLLRLDGTTEFSWLHVKGRRPEDLELLCADIPGTWSLWQGTVSTAEEDLPF